MDEIRVRFIGDRGSDIGPHVHLGADDYAAVLAASAFSHVERTSYAVHYEYSIDRVVGLQLTFSYTTPRQLGDRADEYAAAVRRGLLDALGPGPYPIDEHTDVIVARRAASGLNSDAARTGDRAM